MTGMINAKGFAVRLGWKALSRVVGARAGALSFSQEGEDRILSRFFEDRATGVYVDVGAHHPIRFSNTFALYLRGWRGLNIDPLPGSSKLFDAYRPGDQNLQVAIGRDRGTLSYFMFHEPAVNTLDPAVAAQREREGFSPLGTLDVPVRPLSDILEERTSAECGIDLLSVDVEGMDLVVLQSNNWEKYRPEYVCVEALGLGDTATSNRDPLGFMIRQGYDLVASTRASRILRRGS